jgi:hypothetical protein
MFARRLASAACRLALAAALFFGLATASDTPQQEFGPPFNIGGEPQLAAAHGSQSHPSVAHDGGSFFVVWEDRRGGSSRIFGARVSESGEVLDVTGTALSYGAQWQGDPDVCFDGTNYFVVWADSRGIDSDIYGARVDRSGRVLDPEGIPICRAKERQETPSVAFDGRRYLVAWEDRRDGSDVYAARVDTSGRVTDPEGFPVSTAYSCQDTPDLCFDGTNYLLVWNDCRSRAATEMDIYGARVDTAGSVLDLEGIAISADLGQQAIPAVAFDGDNYLVVWRDFRDRPSGRSVYGARVDTSGVLLDKSGIKLSEGTGNVDVTAIGFDGENYVVAWGGNQETSAIRVDPTGRPAGTGQISIAPPPGNKTGAALATDGGTFLVAWSDDFGGSHDVFAARVDGADSVLEPGGMLLSKSAESQRAPDVAAGGGAYLAVWQNHRDYPTSISGTIVNASGAVHAAAGELLVAEDYRPERPCVASDGSEYMVVWEDKRFGSGDIFATRVDGQGKALDPEGIHISTAPGEQTEPDIAFDGHNYMVVWEDDRNQHLIHYSARDIHAARVTSGGTALDPEGIPVSTVWESQRHPAVAGGDGRNLVVWEDWRDEAWAIYGARVLSSGKILDPDGILVTAAGFNAREPDVALNEDLFLVVWVDNLASYAGVYGSRVDLRGNVLDPDGLAIATEGFASKHSPRVAAVDDNFLVSWTDSRTGASLVYGATVDCLGRVSEVASVPAPDGRSDSWTPALASLEPGNALVVFSSFVPQSLFGTDRIHGAAWHAAAKSVPIKLIPTPNPSPGSVRIGFELPACAWVRLDVFDAGGRLVKSFDGRYCGSGWNDVSWDGRDRDGRPVPGGVYFIKLQSRHGEANGKVVLLR